MLRVTLAYPLQRLVTWLITPAMSVVRHGIAFVVPDIANAFFATLIEEVEQIVAEKGYRLLIMNTKETLERETGVLHALSRAIPHRKSKTQPNMI